MCLNNHALFFIILRNILLLGVKFQFRGQISEIVFGYLKELKRGGYANFQKFINLWPIHEIFAGSSSLAIKKSATSSVILFPCSSISSWVKL